MVIPANLKRSSTDSGRFISFPIMSSFIAFSFGGHPWTITLIGNVLDTVLEVSCASEKNSSNHTKVDKLLDVLILPFI